MVPGPGGPTNEDRTVNNSDDDLRQAIALFRYGVIADLVHLPLGTKGMVDKMRDKAGQPYTIPGTNRTRVAAETIRGWIKLYRYGGFDALYPKPRTDRGQPRRLPPEVAERLIALKTDNPTWSVRAVIRAARDGGVDHPLAPSTVHRLLSREGLFDKKPPDGADRRRFAFRDAGELWMSDVMHGPKVRLGRSRRKTYLIAFIDDASGFAVQDDEGGAGFLGEHRQPGGGVNDERRADGEEEVAGKRLALRALHLVLRHRLAEGNRRRLDRRAAERAGGWHGVPFERLLDWSKLVAGLAGDAFRIAAVAVELDHLLPGDARILVQVVNVLGDHA